MRMDKVAFTISFGKEPFDFEHSICDILKRDPIGIEECIYNIKDNLDIIQVTSSWHQWS